MWAPIVAIALDASLTMGQAHAVVPANEIVVAFGGSDTTAKVLDDIVPLVTGSSVTVDAATKTARVFNIPPFSTGTSNVPGDTQCGDVGWVKDPLAPAANSATTKGISPFGSSAGRNYLGAEHDGSFPGSVAGEDLGCIDIARSSSGPRNGATGGDFSSFEYYAFAMDAMSWGSTSLKAPATLTRQQITDIYDCVVTNWDQVGGTSGPIKRYMPQVGSGTRAFFLSDILVGKASGYVPPNGGACGASPATDFVYIEENRGKDSVESPGIKAADFDKAILPYSAAVWSFQEANRLNPTLDIRGGVQLRGITEGVTKASPIAWNGSSRQYALDTAGVINENNIKLIDSTPDFPGVRYVFNVLDNVSNRPGYQAAKQLVGFSNVGGGTKSPLCDSSSALGGDLFAAILSNKFGPLPSVGPAGTIPFNQNESNCRLFFPTGAPS